MEEEKKEKRYENVSNVDRKNMKVFPLKKIYISWNPYKYIPLMYSTMFILRTCFKSQSFVSCFYLLSLFSLLVNLWFSCQLGSSRNVPSSRRADDLEPVVLKLSVTP